MTQLPESDTNLRRFDLNLLPILRALLSTSSVARSAEILGLSQSATSGALTRLRTIFSDPLLVQIGRNLVLTPAARELQPVVEGAFASLHLVFNKRIFVPDKESRQFTIATSDYVVSELCVPLLKLLTEEAPQISVKFIEISHGNRARMITGDIDFVLTPQNNPPNSDEVHSMDLSVDEMTIISGASFSMPSAGLDLETYTAADHAAYGLAHGETFEQWALSGLGVTRRIRVTVPQFVHLPLCVAETNCLAMMPRHVAERFAKDFALKIWPVPFDIPKIHFSLIWSNVLHHSPAHAWFRQLIARAWVQAWSS